MRMSLALSALALLTAPAGALLAPCCCSHHVLKMQAPQENQGCCGDEAPVHKPKCGCLHDTGAAEPAQPVLLPTAPAALVAVADVPRAAPVVETRTVNVGSGTLRHTGDPPLYLAISSLRL